MYSHIIYYNMGLKNKFNYTLSNLTQNTLCTCRCIEKF